MIGENIKSEGQTESQYMPESIEDFLSVLEEKNHIVDEKEFWLYFDWERTQSFLKELMSIKELLKSSNLMEMDLIDRCESILLDLKHIVSILSYQRMRDRNRDSYTDKPIVLYRGIRQKNGLIQKVELL